MKRKIHMELLATAVFAILLTLLCALFVFYGVYRKQVIGDLKADALVMKNMHIFDNISDLHPDAPCSLTFKEYELLKLLLHNAGIVVTREIILERVWGIDFEGESRTLDMHIRTLRQKLGEAGSMIRTVRNVGYMIE